MTGWPCWNCGAPSWDEAAPTPEVWCCDLTFAEREQSAKKRLDQGDQGELLRFINWCFVQRREVPAWARQKFDDAVNRVRGFEVKSWDDVFGRPLRKGQQLAANRRKGVETAARVWKCANARRRAGEPVDKATFAAIGRDLGIGGSTVVSEIYGTVLREFRESDEAEKHGGGTEGPVHRETVRIVAIFDPPFDPDYDGPPRKALIIAR
jgi:hypothetical protein